MAFTSLEEIEQLRTTNEQLEAQVHEIRTKQSAVLLRLNELSSTTRNLPSEILATIFSEVCHDPSFKRANVGHPLVQVVCQVCSRWRHVAKNTPSLWTHIEVMLPVPKWATTHSFNLLQLYYANSGMLPLSISLNVVPEYRRPPSHPHRFYEGGNRHVPYTDLFRIIFVEFPSKLGFLTIGEDADINRIWLQAIASFTTTFTQDGITYANLTKIDLKASYEDYHSIPGSGDIPPTRFFQSALHVPRLCRLALHYDIASIQIPLENLTSLTLTHSRPKECLDILVQYPRLIEFCAMELDPSPEPPEPPISLKGEILSLTNLQKLSWDFGYHEWDMILTKNFRFPHLSSLYADNHCTNIPLEPDSSPVTAFLDQWTHFLCSLPALHTLGCGFGDAPTQFFKAITNTSGLEVLHLWAGQYDDLEEDQSALQDLFLSQFLPPESLMSHSGAIDPKVRGLPMIRSLHLYDGLGDFPTTEQMNSFLDALESRWRVSVPQTQNSGLHRLESCTLYMLPKYNPESDSSAMVWENWTPKQLGRIDKLKEEGFRFRLEEQNCGLRCGIWQ